MRFLFVSIYKVFAEQKNRPASRAIGETMIVVLAAGNSPLLHVNPLEAVSTVTITIVNQLTGDTDFASPQALVAFSLGLTLFVITLGLNIVALYIRSEEHTSELQ